MLKGHMAACGMMGHVAYLLFSIINKGEKVHAMATQEEISR